MKPKTRFDSTTPEEKKRPQPRKIWMVFEKKEVSLSEFFPNDSYFHYADYRFVSVDSPVKAFYFERDIPPQYKFSDKYFVKEIDLE